MVAIMLFLLPFAVLALLLLLAMKIFGEGD